MRQYLDLMERVLTEGVEKRDRTGVGTLSIFGHQIRFDLTRGFPMLTTKKLHLKSIVYELLWFLRGDALRREADAIIVAGGADIYAQALPLATRLVITYIHAAVEGDALFPTIDRRVWREIARDEHAAAHGDDAAFTFVTYERVSSAPSAAGAAL